MANTYDEKIPFILHNIQITGLFKQGHGKECSQYPLIVLIHGGGMNAAYFDNSIYSIPRDLSELGYDVLNIHRPGYGPNPIPETQTPFKDGLPVFIEFIAQVYEKHCKARRGIILIGHSLGAAVCLMIAAEAEKLPLLGVSALGIAPVKGYTLPFPEPDPEPENPRIVFEHSPELVRRLFGPLEYVNGEIFRTAVLQLISQPDFSGEIMPAVKIPVQYLAAEYELAWLGAAEARPVFHSLAQRFTNAPYVEAELLPCGGHNYEFSKNATILFDLRRNFIQKLVTEESC